MITQNFFAKKFLFGAAVVSMIAFSSCKNNENDSKEVAEEQNEHIENDSKENDAQFLVDVASAHLAEIKLGSLAASKAQHAELKAYGEMLEKDHSDALMKLQALATQKNITVPSTITEEGQEMYEDMNKKDLKDFDEDYVDHMVKDHKKDIEKLNDYIKDGTDADIKSYAEAVLPTMQAHLAKAESMQAMMKKK